MAQINLLVGAISSNTDTVLRASRRAIDEYSANMIVFPELTIIGYPPEDLLLRPSLVARIDEAVLRLRNAKLDIVMVVGLPLREGARLYNGLMVIHRGEILGIYRKQCLPNYQVFDERRYFDAGNKCLVLKFGDADIAFTVCEDLWEPGPTLQARDGGASLLININASPFHLDKVKERQALLRSRARAGVMPILYVNLVGGQDELVFDGASMLVDRDGECIFVAPSFREGLYSVDLEISGRANAVVPVTQVNGVSPAQALEEQVYQALVLGVRDYVNKNRFRDVVIGLSGGIDSALTLAIAVDALGHDRVRAVMMPFVYTSDLSLNAARQQALRLGVNYVEIPIAEPYHALLKVLKDEFAGLPSDVAEQNIQARCRGMVLMAISNKKGSLVLTTGNKSEIAVGYSTLYGDMAGGFDVLKDVYKTLVYRLAHYRNLGAGTLEPVIPLAVIQRPPSAELAPGQLDQDSLPPYEILDRILEFYVEQDQSAISIIRQGFDEATVHRVLRLVDLSEYKRRQSPVGVRLTQRGFGRDRRYPITNGWELGE